ncbi:MAG TPA: AAA family ATPase [Candidatus Angelobacter sp.]|nr:AAA family ATPase [Candidatus Angelobacter sp.]
MIKPIMNPASEKLLHAVVKRMPQSLLLTGENGVGLGTISRYIAELCKVTPIVILPEFDEKVDIDKGVIGVDIMRRLYNETRTKTESNRIIIIDYAERMTHQAQNAFLKLLEEPGKGVYFILVSHSVSKLLPTILSRTENLDIKLITTEQSEKLLASLGIMDITKRSQLLFMAKGMPAELIRLCNDEAYFGKRSVTVRDARELLRGSLYQKLSIAQRYKDDRASALILLLDVANILKRSVVARPRLDTISRIDAILDAYQHIEANGNIRLCLARMVI